jgi:hypothetical protein
MGFFNKMKLNQIKKLEAAKSSAGIIKLFPKINDPFISDAALEALGRIGDSLAVNELKNRFNKLYVNDNLKAERYIKILKSSANQEAFDFIRQIYKNKFYQDSPTCMFHYLSMSALIDIGDVDVLMENIDTLNNNTNVQPTEQEVICLSISKNINDEKMLLRIISESKINAFCYEALKKIKDINNVTEQILEKIICNKAITNAILPRINDTGLLLKILTKAKDQGTDSYYAIFDMLLKEINRRGFKVSHTVDQVECHFCEGKGSYKRHSDFDSDFGNMYHLVSCSRCNATGKINVNDICIEHDGLKISLRVYRNEKHEIDRII